MITPRVAKTGWLILAVIASASGGGAQFFRGVNVSGAEFGENQIPGVFNTDYTYNSELTYRYFAARNLNLIRLPLMWERLQPVLRGTLDPLNLGLLKSVIGWARADGNLVILDIHNYGRYSMNENGKLNTYVIDQAYGGVVKVSQADLADLWVRLSNEFANEPAVYAYDIMNEPHDMAGWKNISQAVLTAIRNNGDGKLVMIPGDSWSSANRWQTVHGPFGWISDPVNNFMYEAHQYFDSDESGTYAKSYDAELTVNPSLATVGSTRVAHFVDWCRNNSVRGYVGEYGVPDSDPRWWSVLSDFLKALDAAQFSGTYWAAGEWWGNYPLSVEPIDSFTVDRPQMPTLLGHLPPGMFTPVSAASAAGTTFAPGSLMSGYGSGLAAASGAAVSVPWPISLAGTTVELTDSSGVTLNAPLIFVSSGQINYLIPEETAAGKVSAAVKSGGSVVARGTCILERVAPTLFTATGGATGPAAATILRVTPDGTQDYEYTVILDPAQQKIVPLPIDFGDAGDRLFLSLYGTGWRNAAAPSQASLRAGNVVLSISYFGPQPGTPGLDQINAELPRSLAGAGLVAVGLLVDGKPANPATLTFR